RVRSQPVWSNHGWGFGALREMSHGKDCVVPTFRSGGHADLDIAKSLTQAVVQCGNGVFKCVRFQDAFHPAAVGIKTTRSAVLYIDVHHGILYGRTSFDVEIRIGLARRLSSTQQRNSATALSPNGP